MNPVLSTPVQKLSTDVYLDVSAYIQQHYGIQLPLSKKKMVEARLQKRLKALELESFEAYFDYVFTDDGKAEYGNMIDIITTNKTEFFRENAHFELLTSTIIPELTRQRKEDQQMKIWSAGCSTGEEVYSIIITLEEFQLKNFERFPYKVLGSDLSMQVLKRAFQATYPADRIEDLSLHQKRRYFLRNKDRENPLAKVKPEFTSNVVYKRVNLLKPLSNVESGFDIIFCRNVLIYFNRETQAHVINQLLSKLKPGGFLFIGHSESLTDFRLPLIQIKPTVYKKIAL